MRKVICILLTLFLVDYVKAAVDGTYIKSGVNQQNILSEPINLLQNQNIRIINGHWDYSEATMGFVEISISGQSTRWKFRNINSGGAGSTYELLPVDARTLNGPLIISSITLPRDGQLFYEISTKVEDEKYSVSLNDDGSRLAIGYKEDGSNALTRVYEFDGADWQQIGTDID